MSSVKAQVDQTVNAVAGTTPGGVTNVYDSNPNFVPPPPYQSAPWFLLLKDLGVIFSQLPYLPYVFLPLNLMQGGLLQDMTVGGLIFQVVAFMISLALLPVAFVSFSYGLPWPALVVFGTLVLVKVLYIMQGDQTIIPVDETITGKFPNETWFFINGICTTTSGHKKALIRLNKLFHRKIIGINNKSLGIITDLLECLFQRDLRWLTNDIRTGYAVVKTAVADKDIKRIVIIAHSQGGIIASAIVDQLLNDFDASVLSRVEVYTFASAANHFSSPLDRHGNPTFHAVEHFAHTKDMVAKFGVLKYAFENQIQVSRPPVPTFNQRSTSGLPQSSERFAGRVFVQEGSGHMILGHYLAANNNILETPVAREHSRLAKYLGGGRPE